MLSSIIKKSILGELLSTILGGGEDTNPPATGAILLESSDFLLLEDGSKILLQ